MATVTVSSVSSATSSQQLVAANTARSHVVLVNTDANRMYFRLGSSAATTVAGGFTDYLDEGDDVSIDGDDAKLAIQAIWLADGSGAVSITQTLTETLSGAGATTILGMIQEVCRKIGLEIPDSIFSSTVREHIELAEIANEVRDMITRAHRWRKLLQRATYTGDGSTKNFNLPEDFGWMPDDQQIWSSTAQTPFTRVQSLDDWLAMEVRKFNPGRNGWIIYGGQMHFTPALDNSESAYHYYQSTASVAPATGTAKSTFTLDTDTFRIDDQLLKLGMCYLWKQHKGLPYAEFLNDFEVLKEKLIARDRGATMFVQGRMRWPADVVTAYPFNVPVGR